jgi:hypothetical protein
MCAQPPVVLHDVVRAPPINVSKECQLGTCMCDDKRGQKCHIYEVHWDPHRWGNVQ